jgi:hypothetical protein
MDYGRDGHRETEHVVSDSLAFGFLTITRQDHYPAFPQRSPPWLFTNAA